MKAKLVLKRMLRNIALVLLLEATVALCGYGLLVFSDASVFVGLRTIWIETAMTTGEHQWLATAFFPKETIRSVMDAQIVDVEGIGGLDLDFSQPEMLDRLEGQAAEDASKPDDILGQQDLVVGGPDYVGNTVLVNDVEQGIVISEVKGSSYRGKVVMIDDPSRVRIATTENKGGIGEKVLGYLEQENALIACNANGFQDYNGVGDGGDIIGLTYSSGQSWGDYLGEYVSFGFDTEDRFLVGYFSNWEDYQIRDGAQFKPALIVDGEQLISGTAGYGLQPRTVIGQRADGVVIILVVDGRQVGWSTGIALGQCADILYAYGCVNAAACDGGSSSILAYDGEIITRCSSPASGGRYLPNAWVVDRKEVPEEPDQVILDGSGLLGMIGADNSSDGSLENPFLGKG